MKFCYCPECDRIRPRNWYGRDRCDSCRGECIIYQVNRTVYGKLMYILDAIAFLLVILYLASNDFGWEAASFMDAVPTTFLFGVIFGLIVLSFVFAFIDLSKTTQRVSEMARARKVKKTD